jgi:hypothetical protein
MLNAGVVLHTGYGNAKRCRAVSVWYRFLVQMASQGAVVCQSMLRDSGTFLQERPTIQSLMKLLSSIGYEASIGPLEVLKGIKKKDEAVSPILPELFVRRRLRDAAAPPIAVQVVLKANCFRCAYHMCMHCPPLSCPFEMGTVLQWLAQYFRSPANK